MKFKKWEAALIAGFVITFMFGLSGVCNAENVSNKLVRLHIIANSDEEYDQNLKIKVRDAVLPVVQRLTAGAEDVQAAWNRIYDNLDEIEREAEKCVREQGYNYSVTLAMENAYFPTKNYADFALPAGEYSSLRIIIGNGSGKNWWCVLFPPLCVPAAEGNIEDIAEAYGLSDDDVAFITNDGCSYKIKFKSAELYGEIKEWIKNHF